jgi:hypothetical protein
MEKLRELAPDRLEIGSGGGFMSVFGLPFLAAGIFLTLVGFRVILPSNSDEIPVWGWPLMVLMALAFVAVGGGLVFGRTWKTIDRSRGIISVQWGLLVPMKVTEYGLYDYSAVVLSYVAGDSDSSERYPVVLQGNVPKSNLTLTSPTSYPISREQAEMIARVLRLPLVDRSTDHESVMEPEASRRSFSERSQRTPGTRETVPPPSVMRSTVKKSVDSTTITIPGPGFRLAAAVQFVIPLVFALYVLLNVVPFFDRTNTPAPVQGFFLAFASLFVLIPLARAVYTLFETKMRTTIVSTSPRGMVIEERRMWRTRATEIAADKILDVDYSTSDMMPGTARIPTLRLGYATPDSSVWTGAQTLSLPLWLQKLRTFFPAKGITVKARTGLFTFGAGLADDEVRYLHCVVTHALAGAAMSGESGSVPVNDVVDSSTW